MTTTARAEIVTSLCIFLRRIHQRPVLHNQSLVSCGAVHRCHFFWNTGEAATETVQLEEDYGQDGAQEEGGEGGGDSKIIEIFFSKFICTKVKSVIVPDRPANVPNSTDSHVDPSELLAKYDT